MTSPYETPDEFANEAVRDFHHKCTYCPESRRSKSALAAHIYRVHRRAEARERTAAGTNAGMDAAKQDIASMGRTLADIAERMQRLDDAATSPDAVRRATLREVHDRLIEAGDYSAAMLVNKMLKDGA